MPTFGDIRRQVREKAVALLGHEISEQALRGCCGILATVTLTPWKAETQLRDPEIPQCDELLTHVTLYFAE